MKTRLRPLSSKSKRISISKKKKSSRANSGSVKPSKKSSENTVSNNYFINNINIGNLKHKISGNANNQHSAMIFDMKKRLMNERRKRLTVNSLVENSLFLKKIEKKERSEKRHKKTKSFSFAGAKASRDQKLSRASKINEILNKSNFFLKS